MSRLFKKRVLCVLTSIIMDQSSAMSVTSEAVKLTTNFKEWSFSDPPNYAKLPIDENPEYNRPVAVKNAIFSKVPTEPLTGNISLVCSSDAALQDILDLDPKVAKTEEFIAFAAGKYLPKGSLTVCHRYGGYQFGFWADQLGDGRAHILGEYVNSKGESWQPQLKGCGVTPYSRFGDGRAVLRSSIREMVASEACHALGVPTTRAAALVVSDTHTVYRDKMYSGHARPERCAVVVRLAPAWFRIGSLEILVRRSEPGLLKGLVDFIIENHFPNIDSMAEDKYVKWFEDVCHRNLDMVATWQGVGFTHGVLNTDNISLLGLTIDYGPYGFLDRYNKDYIPNTSDDMGRYAFNSQPEIVMWNLQKLSEALALLLTDEQKEEVKLIVNSLNEYVKAKILKTYLTKLGLVEVHEGDSSLVDGLLELMLDQTSDWTMTWRQLGEVPTSDLEDISVVSQKWALHQVATSGERWSQWVLLYRKRLEKEQVSEEVRRDRMSSENPVYVPRNWMLQEAIVDAEDDDFEKVRFLMKILTRPFEENAEAESRGYSSQPPNWSYGLKLSCSS